MLEGTPSQRSAAAYFFSFTGPCHSELYRGSTEGMKHPNAEFWRSYVPNLESWVLY